MKAKSLNIVEEGDIFWKDLEFIVTGNWRMRGTEARGRLARITFNGATDCWVK